MPNPEILRRRIAQVANQVIPGCQVVFDGTPFEWVRFRIEDGSGQTIVERTVDYHVSEIAEWSDHELREVLRKLTRSPK